MRGQNPCRKTLFKTFSPTSYFFVSDIQDDFMQTRQASMQIGDNLVISLPLKQQFGGSLVQNRKLSQRCKWWCKWEPVFTTGLKTDHKPREESLEDVGKSLKDCHQHISNLARCISAEPTLVKIKASSVCVWWVQHQLSRGFEWSYTTRAVGFVGSTKPEIQKRLSILSPLPKVFGSGAAFPHRLFLETGGKQSGMHSLRLLRYITYAHIRACVI